MLRGGFLFITWNPSQNLKKEYFIVTFITKNNTLKRLPYLQKEHYYVNE
jgi:hypothetical protein